MAEFVTVDVDGDGVATIRLDRPKVNALSPPVWEQLAAAGRRCTDDDAVRAVVLWGGPTVFAAGADIGALHAMEAAAFAAAAESLQSAFRVIAGIPKVVIAAVNGYALGGGCELALTADFRYAGESAVLGQPEIQLGLLPGAGGTQRLPRLIGWSRAKELVYTGRHVDAVEALGIGLVDRVVPDADVHGEAVRAAATMATGPYALRLAKRAIDAGLDVDLETGLRLETALFAAAHASEDREIGMRSFLASGPGHARFTGR